VLKKNEFQTKILIRGIPPDIYRKAKSIAVLQGKTLGQYIGEALMNLNAASDSGKRD